MQRYNCIICNFEKGFFTNVRLTCVRILSTCCHEACLSCVWMLVRVRTCVVVSGSKRFLSTSLTQWLVLLYRQAFKKLQSANTELRHEIRKLQSEKQKLSNVLQSHLVTCQKGDNPDVIIPPTSSSPPSSSALASSSSSQIGDIVVMDTSTEEASEESSDLLDEE